MTRVIRRPNHWLQATRDPALRFFPAHWPRVPEPKRSATGDGFLINNYD